MNNTFSKPISLVGMMGSGKTYIGRILANEAGIPFYDVDKVIEEKAGMSIAEIFERYGENKFRASEHKSIQELVGRNVPCVISTGGGALTTAQTLTLLKEQTQMVWIDSPFETLWARLQSSKDRPLLQTDAPQDTLKTLIEKRTPLYRQAHHHVINDGKSAQKLVRHIIKSLS